MKTRLQIAKKQKHEYTVINFSNKKTTDVELFVSEQAG